MIKFSIRAPLVKTALLFQAKQDVRYYLNGFRVESNRIISTNGHCLWIHDFDDVIDISAPMTIKLKGNIPVKAYTLNFEACESSGVVFSADADGKIISANYFEIIDGDYPDIDKVIPKSEACETLEIGFNAEYLALLSKAAKLVGNPRYPNVIGNLRGPNAVSVFKIHGPEFKSKVLLMPVRL